MYSVQLILAAALFCSFSEGRFIVDLTHTFDKDATKYPLGILGVDNVTYFDHWILSTGYSERDDTNHKMW